MLATLSGADLLVPKVESVPCVEGGKTKSLPEVSPGGEEGRVIVIEVWGGAMAARAVVARRARVVRSCMLGFLDGWVVGLVVLIRLAVYELCILWEEKYEIVWRSRKTQADGDALDAEMMLVGC